MRVFVHDPGKQKTVRLRLPTALICNRLTAAIAAHVLKKRVTPATPLLTQTALYTLMKELRRCRHRLRPLHFVEIRSTDGAEVIIDL